MAAAATLDGSPQDSSSISVGGSGSVFENTWISGEANYAIELLGTATGNEFERPFGRVSFRWTRTFSKAAAPPAIRSTSSRRRASASSPLSALGRAEHGMTRAVCAFRRAYANSGESNVIMGPAYWNYMLQIGRLEQSLSVIETLRRVDPLVVNGADAPPNILYLLGRRDAPSPSNTTPTTLLQLDALLATASDDAVTSFAQGTAPGGLDHGPFGVVWAAAPEARARALRDYVTEHNIINRTTLTTLVFLAARLGEEELAVELLRNTFIELDGFSGYWFIWARTLREARRTEAFKDFLRDVGLVDLWRETGEWGDFCRPLDGEDFECA